MGQQQLLLIVLGVIIVGIAVVVGINVFTASSAQANQDAVIADMTTLAASAQQFYRKPIALGGGGNAFTNWVLTPATTPNGTYAISGAISADAITIIGTGNSANADGQYPLVTMVISPSKIVSTVPSLTPVATE